MVAFEGRPGIGLSFPHVGIDNVLYAFSYVGRQLVAGIDIVGSELRVSRQVTVQTGGTDVRLGKACVDFEPNYTLSPDDGNAGLDIIHGCRKATLNLKDMFLKIEN